ncbi:MAG: sensor histidine kinase [Actinocrinis sp.]
MRLRRARVAAVRGLRAHGVRWFWHRTPLWTRLVAGTLALVALGLTITGIIGISLLRDYLVNQSSQQLRAFGSAVAEAHRYKPISSPLNCGALPNDTATELIASSAGQVAIASSCPAWVNDAGVLPDLPARSDLMSAARARTSFVTANRGTPALRWEVVVVPMMYHISTNPTPGATGTGTGTNAAGTSVVPAATTAPGYVLVATSLNDVDGTVAQLTRLEIAVDSAVGAALILLGYFIVRTALRPLNHIETAAEAISAGDLSRRVPQGHPKTETGRLSRSLNGMLGQIEAAFSARERSEGAARDSEERMRQFVADASHELRTPLTSIRGFAELHRQGAVVPERVPDLIRRIESEAVRMGVLVEDLLLLARLDEQRPLAHDRVHLAALAAESIAGAQARAPGRRIDLHVEHPSVEPVVIGDETRLRQALDNLLDNALRHTPPDARISVRVRASTDPNALAGGTDGKEPGTAPDAGRDAAGPRVYLLEVADTGPGLSPQAAAHVFERFYRADPARQRNSSVADRGAGLGLAIVAAITAAHGGTATVHTAPDQGALFRLTLPAARASAPVADSDADADADTGMDMNPDSGVEPDAGTGLDAGGDAGQHSADRPGMRAGTP